MDKEEVLDPGFLYGEKHYQVFSSVTSIMTV